MSSLDDNDSELSFDSDELGLPNDLGLSQNVFELYCNPAAAESDNADDQAEEADATAHMRSLCAANDVHGFIRELTEAIQSHEHAWFLVSLPAILEGCRDPVDFVLTVLSNQSPRLRRKASRVSSGTIDLPLLVANALGTFLVNKGVLTEDHMYVSPLTKAASGAQASTGDKELDPRKDHSGSQGSEQSSDSPASSPRTDESEGADVSSLDSAALLTEKHIRRARDIVCRPFLPPRTALALLRSCGVDVRAPSLVQRIARLVRELLEDKEYSQASYWISKFMLFDQFSNEEFVLPLIKRKGRGMQSLLDYAESIEESSSNSGGASTSLQSSATGSESLEQPVLTADASSLAIISLSELRRRTQSYIIQHVAESGEGNSPNAALKLIKRWDFRYDDFPRVIYLNKKNILWWSAKAGKTREFSDLVCGDDVRLQRYVCRQLRKDRKQYEDFCFFVEKYGFAEHPEFAPTYNRWKAKPPVLLGDRDGAGGDSDEGLPPVPPALEARVSSTTDPRVVGGAESKMASSSHSDNTESTGNKSSVVEPTKSRRQRRKDNRRAREKQKRETQSAGKVLKKPSVRRQTSVKLGLDGQVIRGVDDDVSSDDGGGGAGHDRRLLAQLGLNGGGGGIVQEGDEQFLEMDESMLVFVDDEATLAEAMEVLLSKDTDVIGLDQERMPDNLRLFHNLPEHCQTLQIAARRKTFVFDLSKFKVLVQMEECFRHVFEREDTIKIGMGFAGDISAMQDDFPDALCFTSTLPKYLELEEVLKHIPRDRSSHRSTTQKGRNSHSNRGGGGKKHGRKQLSGLARLVHFCTGKHLNKFEQLSNWSRRPLRQSQLVYAGLDAYCEILVYDKLEILSAANQIPLLRDFFDDLMPM